MSFCIVAPTAWIFEHLFASIIVFESISDWFALWFDSAVIKDLNSCKQWVVVLSDFIMPIVFMRLGPIFGPMFRPAFEPIFSWWTLAVIWKALTNDNTIIIVKIFILLNPESSIDNHFDGPVFISRFKSSLVNIQSACSKWRCFFLNRSKRKNITKH